MLSIAMTPFKAGQVWAAPSSSGNMRDTVATKVLSLKLKLVVMLLLMFANICAFSHS